ncbi:hypothetical protein E5D57_001906 [Metarhizium anisopliae]|nr:hypothetical protein E5D57_001906 [Metarhizium anisopliae]
MAPSFGIYASGLSRPVTPVRPPRQLHHVSEYWTRPHLPRDLPPSLGRIFGQVFTARDVVSDESDGGVYYIGVPSKNVPVARAASEEHLDVEVSLHAWKDQKCLNSWIIGEIQRWGTLSEEVRAGR